MNFLKRKLNRKIRFKRYNKGNFFEYCKICGKREFSCLPYNDKLTVLQNKHNFFGRGWMASSVSKNKLYCGYGSKYDSDRYIIIDLKLKDGDIICDDCIEELVKKALLKYDGNSLEEYYLRNNLSENYDVDHMVSWCDD